MDTFFKIIGVIVALFVPIGIAYLNNKLGHLKESRESRLNLLNIAKDFESEDLKNRSILYKDRMAKLLFNNDNLTYHEAKYFSNYENSDIWIQQYIKIKGLLKKERDSLGSIIGFEPNYSFLKILLVFLCYIFFGCIGLIPIVITNKFVGLITKYFEEGVLLNAIGLIIFPVVSLFLAWTCLKYIEYCADCSVFLNNFKEKAFDLSNLEGLTEVEDQP